MYIQRYTLKTTGIGYASVLAVILAMRVRQNDRKTTS
jgi:hypothetical protein